MINFPRSCFCVVAMLLRQYSGGRIIGFVALLHALSGLLVFTGVLLFLRGFLTGTAVGSLLAVPIAVPMLLFIAVVVGVWVGRSFGWLTYAGPMRLIGPNDGFTGHAGEIIRRRFNVEHEWTLLERYEPAVVSAAGVALCVLPWTRAIGCYVVLMAIAAAWQSTRDRRVNAWQQADPEEEFAQPFGDHSAPGDGVETAFDALGDVSVLLDQDAVRDATAQTTTVREEPRSFISVAPGVMFKPRGPVSVHPKPRVTPVVMGLIAILIANFAAGDVAGLYGRAPVRWIAGVESLQSAGAVLGLARPETEQGPGELTGSFLERVDSDALESWKDSNARDVIRPAREALTAAAAAVQNVRLAVVSKLGFELTLDSHTDLFDELLLKRPSVREAWAALLNGVAALEQAIGDADERLTKAERQAGRASLSEVRLVGEQAAGWKTQAESLHAHIEHITIMLGAMETERALDNAPGDGG